jgi:mannose-1-phosphate guanylyltransferase
MGAMASAIVLCAGFGTRLRPLTDELPKPLVPVGDRSILEHTVGHLREAGFAEVVINVHHLASTFDRYIGRLALPVQVVVEADIRGTAGGVAGSREYLRAAPVLVWNGDILGEPPIDALLANASSAHFCLAVAPRADSNGTVGLDEHGHVVRLRGERFGTETRSGDYVGVLAFGAQVQDSLPDHGCLFGDVALPWLRAGGLVTSVPATRPWTDAGDPRALLSANLAWLSRRAPPFFAAESAQIAATVELRNSVVGAGARVQGHGLLERCVVCPGATAFAPLADAIVAPSGRVVPCGHV